MSFSLLSDDLSQPAQQPASPIPAPQPQGPPGRRIDDIPAARKAIYENVLSSFKTLPPAANSRYSLQLSNVDYEDPSEYDLKRQKDAILKGETLARRVRGDWALTELGTGREIERRRVTLARIPHLTDRGTYIVNGIEYTMANQMRLRPGMYARRKENGELEFHLNAIPGKGVTHRYFMDPDTGVFRAQFGQANISALTLLRSMGVPDNDIKKAWGHDLFAANDAKDTPKELDKAYLKLIRKGDPKASAETKRASIKTFLEKLEFDPKVNMRTMGVPYTRLDGQAALHATHKLLAISRGEADSDDRDHLANQMFLGPEDLYSERVKRASPTIQQALWKITYDGNLKSLKPEMLSGHIQGALLDSGLGNPLEEVNAADVYDQVGRVTSLGTGGISSADSVPMSSRAVQPSHFGYIDPIRTPESLKAGVDGRVAGGVRKGADGTLYAMYRDRFGNEIWKSPQEVADTPVALPGEADHGRQHVTAVNKGKVTVVHRDAVEHWMPHVDEGFSAMSNLIPFRSANKGQRLSMGSRFLTQALPLVDAESPLVRSSGTSGISYDEMYGEKAGAVRSKGTGRVVAIDPDGISVQYADGTKQVHQLYNYLPNNRKSFWLSTPTVSVGDPVQPGQLLARSNYTDHEGVLALGHNLRTAYISHPTGAAYDDAIAISESAAEKMRSQHMYQHEAEFSPQTKTGRKNFIGIFPAKYDRRMLDQIDDDGAVKPGTILQTGDPIVLGAEPRQLSKKQVHASHGGSFRDTSLTWDHHTPGRVIDVVKTPKGIVATVVTEAGMVTGDKLAGRHGDKGTVVVVPDHQMPLGEDGKPMEVILSSQSMTTRANSGQAYEAMLGKVAQHDGKPVVVSDLGGKVAWHDMVDHELKSRGLSATETLTDPETGRKIPGVLTGPRYLMKLHHMVADKDQGRGLGAYTAEDSPAKTGGSEGSSKRLSLGEATALMSAGATEVLRDAKLIRGQRNAQYWADFMAGNHPATPNVPTVYKKFIEQLRGSGINVVRKGSKSHLYALTDRDIQDLAGERNLENASTVDWDNGLSPVKGGLFDNTLTGGHGSSDAPGRWSAIKLHEPMPNPVMEEPIRRVLGLTGKRFQNILAGHEKLGDKTGPLALQEALKSIDLDGAISQAREDIKSGRAADRDLAVRRLGFLKAAKETGVHPGEWFWTRMPVLPPAFRPVSQMQRGGTLVADANLLYKEVFDANDSLADLSSSVGNVGEERLNLYKAMQGAVGMGDPIQPKNRERRVRGLLQHVFGWSPKQGTVQQKLIGTSVDVVGRSVVVPNAELSMDEVGLPEERAWAVYSPFLVRRMVRDGVPRIEALNYVKDRAPQARKALLAEMDSRPILLSRAPVLHRFGIMAFRPKLIKGDALHTSPLVNQVFGLDHDGDQMNYHVPASDEARMEAASKMLPSKQLYSLKTFKADNFLPRQEITGGLYAATTRHNQDKRPRVFATRRDAIRAYHAGELDAGDPIEIHGN